MSENGGGGEGKVTVRFVVHYPVWRRGYQWKYK